MTQTPDTPTIGQALVAGLKARGVDTVFGIPGVHTIELYRGLAGSGIRHITPRHEAGAAFMADGYARVSGKPGVAFVITGPGVANTLTPMGQARADSVPILVVSGVNARPTLGLGMGHSHELPDQRAMVASVALSATRIEAASDLVPTLDQAFDLLEHGRGGPVHIEVPTDVMPAPCPADLLTAVRAAPRPGLNRAPDTAQFEQAAQMLRQARAPIILVGGGARYCGDLIAQLANHISAPVMQTANARGMMHGHPLALPASPCLDSVRALIHSADAVLAVGTEFGPTEYDMYAKGDLPAPPGMIRIDIDADQLARHPAALKICADAHAALSQLVPQVCNGTAQGQDGATRVATALADGWAELTPVMQDQVRMLEAMRDAAPNSLIVGDSTQPIYAGNIWYDHDRPGGWFNAATGFGALGFGVPAAIGAAIAAPDAHVYCLTGDGGLQFSLAELMTAFDAQLNITFVVWNNHGFQEIADSMQAVGVPVLGCTPTPPRMAELAAACQLPFASIPYSVAALHMAMDKLRSTTGPRMIEICIS